MTAVTIPRLFASLAIRTSYSAPYSLRHFLARLQLSSVTFIIYKPILTAKTVHSYDQHNRECEEQQSFFYTLCSLVPPAASPPRFCLQKCSYGTAVIQYAYSF